MQRINTKIKVKKIKSNNFTTLQGVTEKIPILQLQYSKMIYFLAFSLIVEIIVVT